MINLFGSSLPFALKTSRLLLSTRASAITNRLDKYHHLGQKLRCLHTRQQSKLIDATSVPHSGRHTTTTKVATPIDEIPDIVCTKIQTAFIDIVRKKVCATIVDILPIEICAAIPELWMILVGDIERSMMPLINRWKMV